MTAYNRNPKPDLVSTGGSLTGSALAPLTPLLSGNGGSGSLSASASAAAANAAAADTHRRNPLLVLWNRRWIIVSCLVVAVAAGVIRLKLATNVYESTAQVTIEQNTPRIISNDPNGMMVSSTQNFLWTQCTVIKSRDFLKTVANEPGIRELPSFAPGQSPEAQLAGMVDAYVGRRDDVITVSVRSMFKEDARIIADAIVTSFVKYREGTSRSKARELLDILQNTKVQSDREVAQKRQALLEFQVKNAAFAFGTERGANPTLDRMARLSAALTDAQLATLNAQSAYETAKAMMDDPARIRQLLETRQFKSENAQIRSEIRDMQQRMVQLGRVQGPDNPTMNAIQDTIKRLQEEMATEDKKLVEAYIVELENQLAASKRSEELIESQLNAQRQQLLEFNTRSAQYALLDSELHSAQSFNDIVNDRIKGLSAIEGGGALNILKVDSAVTSNDPVEPNKKATLTMSLLLGGILGTILAFLRDWMDQRLRSVEEIKQVLGLPVLGVVPHISEARTASQRGMHLHNEPTSDVAEAYRTVRTAVYFGQSGGIAKTLLITSPSPGDGKSTLASNLAIAMAQAGSKILVLDADFRKPTQHKIFELDKRIGLSSVLAGETQLANAIHHTAVPGLDVLPCGPIPANPSEILNSQTFADLLAQLAASYDHILLDSPPIMPVTDARILAASCDATVLALRAERSTRKGAIYSRDVLHSVGSQILGVVVNDVPRRKGVYGYYYTYGEQYRYGYGHRRSPAVTVVAATNVKQQSQAS